MAILALRSDPQLVDKLYERKDRVHSRLLPGYDANTWGGILAPAGTPKDVVAKLNSEINKALAAEDVRAKLTAAGIEIQGGTPQRFADYIKGEVAKWGKVTAEAGIQPE